MGTNFKIQNFKIEITFLKQNLEKKFRASLPIILAPHIYSNTLEILLI